MVGAGVCVGDGDKKTNFILEEQDKDNFKSENFAHFSCCDIM